MASPSDTESTDYFHRKASAARGLLLSEYRTLLSEMTAVDPSCRPSADEALSRLKAIMVT